MTRHLAPALRLAAANHGRVDPGLLDAAALALDERDRLIDRLAHDLAVAAGRDDAAVRGEYGLPRVARGGRVMTATAPLRTVVLEWCDCGAGYEAREPDAVIYAAWVAAHAGHRDEGEA